MTKAPATVDCGAAVECCAGIALRAMWRYDPCGRVGNDHSKRRTRSGSVSRRPICANRFATTA